MPGTTARPLRRPARRRARPRADGRRASSPIVAIGVALAPRCSAAAPRCSGRRPRRPVASTSTSRCACRRSPSRAIEGGMRVFSLDARTRRAPTSCRRATTPTLGYNGSYLGPTLVARARRARAGRRARTTWMPRRRCTGTACTFPPRRTADRTQPIAPGERRGSRNGRSTSRRRPSGTTRTCTARRASRSTRGSPACSSCATTEEAALALPRDYGVDDIPAHRAGPLVRRPTARSPAASDAVRRRAGRHHPRQRHARARTSTSRPSACGCGCSTARARACTTSRSPTAARSS